MSGGLLQLVAYGSQDLYISGSPSITFFKVVYRRHTNFSVEAIEQTFNGTVKPGNKVSCTLARNGDLVTTLFIEITLKKKLSNGTTFYPAEQFIQECELLIGGMRIDKIYSDWLRIYDELYRTSQAEKDAYRALVDFERPTGDDGLIKRFYVPLNFYFSRGNPGLALPLIALQYHEVKVDITFAGTTAMEANGVDCTNYQPTATMYATYVFLDTDERRRFAQSSHEYLITTLQYTGAESIQTPSTSIKTNNVRLNLNHPTKALFWVFKNVNNKHGLYTTTVPGETHEKFAPLHEAKLQLNGHDRMQVRRGSYYNLCQPYEALKVKPRAGIYLYSFALKPDEHQPSGSINFSRIDQATLIVSTKQGLATNDTAEANIQEDKTWGNIADLTQLQIYAESYNVLRVTSGMAGLAYAN